MVKLYDKHAPESISLLRVNFAQHPSYTFAFQYINHIYTYTIHTYKFCADLNNLILKILDLHAWPWLTDIPPMGLEMRAMYTIFWSDKWISNEDFELGHCVSCLFPIRVLVYRWFWSSVSLFFNFCIMSVTYYYWCNTQSYYFINVINCIVQLLW